ncbi:MAG: hypothetical protein A3D65_03515 [Candidatus Lloydbacteria bacterium RIFCSPHIGHO2_02_FULL_50_13]|uniref:Uncharacterized protein n=1 Tax=Candidatus Lloydbacteria bacterium RIFCSPHIGHO2_02_FULL_50_13 TaxID=1798661 RepID=A0A1G2D430_9BACT|nr:MAG: hypothetical protein A3D65_03515 [Candidatus Lloydbacteria bacterium RIFCSPHIGHO2_02_FULL_50_13]
MIGTLLFYAFMFGYRYLGGIPEGLFYFLAYNVVVPFQLFVVLILVPAALFRFYTILVKLETNERWDLLIVSLVLVLAAFSIVTNLQYLLY